MTARNDFNGIVADWLDDEAGRGAPDYLDEILARTTGPDSARHGRASKGGSRCN